MAQGSRLEFIIEVNQMNEVNISVKLAELRSAKNVTQEDVALALGVSNKTVSKWENGTSTPDLTMLVALAGYYDVSTDVLLGLKKEHKGKHFGKRPHHKDRKDKHDN